MIRLFPLVSVVVVALAGCSEGSRPPAGKEAPVAAAPEKAAEKGAAETGVGDQAAEPKEGGLNELKLAKVSFIVPRAWKRMEPPSSRIVEAEYIVPKVEGDEFDGSLKVTPAGGDLDSNIARWTGEFNQDPAQGPKVETIKVDGVDVTTVDIRGEWKGPSFAPQDPRADYQMLAVIIPVTPVQSYFVKLVGPQKTLAANAELFREFAKSAHIKKMP